MAFMINKLAMINSCEIILEKKIAKNLCEIQVRTIRVCALHSIKYGSYPAPIIINKIVLKQLKNNFDDI